MAQLAVNIRQLISKAKRKGLIPLIRLNGTSDIRWEAVSFTDSDGVVYDSIFDAFPDTQFYDYTKDVNRKGLPLNYDLTFSYSGVVGFQPFVNKAIENDCFLSNWFEPPLQQNQ
jgi:hypothetical protein